LTASRPPLYFDLLKLPATFAELEKQENVDIKSDIEKFLVKRAGFQHSGVSKHNRQLKRRLEQGVLPREILEAEFKDLTVKVADNEPIVITAVAAADVAKVGGKTKEEAHDFDLALTADNTEYKVDDRPVFTIKSAEDCNLTLVSIDSKGEGEPLLPNRFQQDKFPAGRQGAEVPERRRSVYVPCQGC